ncbi:dipeptide ABC transporter ATP-binding protein [Pseudonocardia sp. GCM10023141]|uniref:ABC transporter ATP-binding protein n=1 Tax=Pseudonocardia sp. GCM10023141 TaxID=3252653 RepID=UPI003608D0DF
MADTTTTRSPLGAEDVLGSSGGAKGAPVLEVKDLRVHFKTPAGTVKAVDGVNWHVNEGETLAIVGESGSGKSVSAMTILGLVPTPPAVFPSGQVLLRGRSLLDMPEAQQRKLRGSEIAMIFQDPLTALNPVFKVGDQIAEMVRVHQKVGKQASLRKAVDLLGEVGIPSPAVRAGQYPHEFSGGMRQRAMIAMALANDPQVLLADEPTTALDVTVQAQIMQLLVNLQESRNTAIVLITHDLGLVASHADRIAVMYAGRIVETGTTDDIFAAPRHAYTYGLLSSLARMDHARPEKLEPIPGQPPSLSRVPSGCAFNPRCRFSSEDCTVDVPQLLPMAAGSDHLHACIHPDEVAAAFSAPRPPAAKAEAAVRSTTPPVVEVTELVKHFPIRSGVFIRRQVGTVQAVNGINLAIQPGTTLSLVGESGCGKSTAARTILRLHEPTSGTVRLGDRDITGLSLGELRKAREDMQIVFQDPYASLNPRMTVRQILTEKYELLGGEVTKNTISELLDTVGLSAEYADRYPHEFSGGQRQRVGIARAIALNPKFVVLDEPVSALDVSIQAQILNLLENLQTEFGLTYLFIAHDLSVVRHISDRVAVMYLGGIVELADRDDLFERPQHPYTQALISAVPIPDPAVERARERILLTGDVPNPANPPSGCRFRTRCWKHLELSETDRQKCIDVPPALTISRQSDQHSVACHFAGTREVLRG